MHSDLRQNPRNRHLLFRCAIHAGNYQTCRGSFEFHSMVPHDLVAYLRTYSPHPVVHLLLSFFTVFSPFLTAPVHAQCSRSVGIFFEKLLHVIVLCGEARQ